jgi:hypothetical protein
LSSIKPKGGKQRAGHPIRDKGGKTPQQAPQNCNFKLYMGMHYRFLTIGRIRSKGDIGICIWGFLYRISYDLPPEFPPAFRESVMAKTTSYPYRQQIPPVGYAKNMLKAPVRNPEFFIAWIGRS